MADVIDLCDSDSEPRPSKKARGEAAAAATAAPPPLTGNALLADLAAARQARGGGAAAAALPAGPKVDAAGRSPAPPLHQRPPDAAVGGGASGAPRPGAGGGVSDTLRLLSYNVWFVEDAQSVRMRAIGAIIEQEQPDVVALQEVTPEAELLFRASRWYSQYASSPSGQQYYTLLFVKRSLAATVRFSRAPFPASRQGRDLLRCTLSLGFGASVSIGTVHAESYAGGQTNSAERVAQIQSAAQMMDCAPPHTAVLLGDLNWDEKSDGDLEVALTRSASSWRDAWTQLRPRDEGFTYNSVANAMLMGNLKKRLDRVCVKAGAFEPQEIRMVGTEPIPGEVYYKKMRGGGSKRMPVLPSDHFGLLCVLRRVSSGRKMA